MFHILFKGLLRKKRYIAILKKDVERLECEQSYKMSRAEEQIKQRFTEEVDKLNSLSLSCSKSAITSYNGEEVNT